MARDVSPLVHAIASFSPSIMLSPTVRRFRGDAFFAVGRVFFFAAIQYPLYTFFGFTVFCRSSIFAWRQPISVFAKTNPFPFAGGLRAPSPSQSLYHG